MVTSALALHSGLHSLINYETDLIVVNSKIHVLTYDVYGSNLINL